MRAVVQDRYGSSEVLRLDRIPGPTPAAGQVLVRVHAAGLDRGTWHLMVGKPYAVRLVMGLRGPRNPVSGKDVAGTVVAVGAGVTRFAVGDEVFGIGIGTFADYAVARADRLARKPANLTFDAGRRRARLRHHRPARGDRRRPGHGRASGCWSWARRVGSAATPSSWPRRSARRSPGWPAPASSTWSGRSAPTTSIDYTREDFADGARRYDLIIDIAGNPALSRLRRALTPTGIVVARRRRGRRQADRHGPAAARRRSVAVRPPAAGTGHLRRSAPATSSDSPTFIEDGAVTPSVDRTYPLERAPEAMRHLEDGKVRGKVAITI